MNKEIVDGPKKSAEQKESLEPKAPECEMAGELSNETSKLVAEFVENVDCVIPGSFSSPSGCDEAKNVVAECSWKSSTLVVFPEEASHRSLFRSEENPERASQINSEKGIMSCDWGSLIPDSADLLSFESQNGMEYDKKPVDPATSFYSRIKDAVQNMHSSGAVVSGDQVGVGSGHENLSAQPGEEIENMESSANITNSSEMLDFEVNIPPSPHPFVDVIFAFAL